MPIQSLQFDPAIRFANRPQYRPQLQLLLHQQANVEREASDKAANRDDKWLKRVIASHKSIDDAAIASNEAVEARQKKNSEQVTQRQEEISEMREDKKSATAAHISRVAERRDELQRAKTADRISRMNNRNTNHRTRRSVYEASRYAKQTEALMEHDERRRTLAKENTGGMLERFRRSTAFQFIEDPNEIDKKSRPPTKGIMELLREEPKEVEAHIQVRDQLHAAEEEYLRGKKTQDKLEAAKRRRSVAIHSEHMRQVKERRKTEIQQSLLRDPVGGRRRLSKPAVVHGRALTDEEEAEVDAFRSFHARAHTRSQPRSFPDHATRLQRQEGKENAKAAHVAELAEERTLDVEAAKNRREVHASHIDDRKGEILDDLVEKRELGAKIIREKMARAASASLHNSRVEESSIHAHSTLLESRRSAAAQRQDKKIRLREDSMLDHMQLVVSRLAAQHLH